MNFFPKFQFTTAIKPLHLLNSDFEETTVIHRDRKYEIIKKDDAIELRRVYLDFIDTFGNEFMKLYFKTEGSIDVDANGEKMLHLTITQNLFFKVLALLGGVLFLIVGVAMHNGISLLNTGTLIVFYILFKVLNEAKMKLYAEELANDIINNEKLSNYSVVKTS